MAIKPTILLIEKDESLRSLIHHFLVGGLSVVGYDSIVYGFEHLKKEKLPHLIILGGTEPKSNQHEFLAYLVGSQFFGHLPILILADQSIGSDLLTISNSSSQVEEILVKPLDLELLKTHIWRALRVTHNE